MEYYLWLVDADLRVVDSHSLFLYEPFDTAIVQVDIYSTTLYEGLTFGLQTFLLNMDRLEFVRDIFEAGWAGVVDSAGELVEQLTTPTRPTVDQTQLFEPEPWDSFERELKGIVDRTET